MCTMLFAASSKPFTLGKPPQDGTVGLAECFLPIPPVMQDREHIAMIVDWHGGKPCCSCVFNENSLPWEAAEEDHETIAAFNFLNDLAEEHGSALTLYATDTDALELEPNVHCRVAPRHLKAGMVLFNIPFKSEMPRVLVKFDPTLAEPDKPETLEIL